MSERLLPTPQPFFHGGPFGRNEYERPLFRAEEVPDGLGVGFDSQCELVAAGVLGDRDDVIAHPVMPDRVANTVRNAATGARPTMSLFVLESGGLGWQAYGFVAIVRAVSDRGTGFVLNLIVRTVGDLGVIRVFLAVVRTVGDFRTGLVLHAVVRTVRDLRTLIFVAFVWSISRLLARHGSFCTQAPSDETEPRRERPRRALDATLRAWGSRRSQGCWAGLES